MKFEIMTGARAELKVLLVGVQEDVSSPDRKQKI